MDRFKEDVLRGLAASPKVLQSKYFYDEAGDELFQQIMASPEYYLTNCEMEIFSEKTEQLANSFLAHQKTFDIIELGAGDATKSSHLLRYLVEQQMDFTYFPIDISKHVIDYLEKELPVQIPGLKTVGLNGEYFEMIKAAKKHSDKPKLLLFLGSNIGNFTKHDAAKFLAAVSNALHTGDTILIGVDLKKNPHQILAAYNDRAGVTKQFNLNLLTRINRELGGNFDVAQFDHYATYDPFTGSCKSYLISLQEQTITVCGQPITFQKNEPLHLELSQKYSVEEMEQLATQTGFKQIDLVYDSHEWFIDAVWEKQ